MFLKNECYFSAMVIEQVSFYAPLLGPHKERMRSTQTLVNTGLN